MATLQASAFLSCSSKSVNASLHDQKPKIANISVPKPQINNKKLVEELNSKSDSFTATVPSLTAEMDIARAKLYAISEAISDRTEMHLNIGQQRDNWNSLCLNSLNAITLAASTMAGISALGPPLLAFKVSSALLFAAATGVMFVMNKIQPSQLAEEQRNAARLFRQLGEEIETALSLWEPDQTLVRDFMDKVLTLDRAYPLPLVGVMIEKFPQRFDPAVWWPPKRPQKSRKLRGETEGNGWSEEREVEMREIVEVLKKKDIEDYVRLGNLALQFNKILAISGPLLTGIAAVGSLFSGFHHSPATAAVAAFSGGLASVVNTVEHGFQVGMVVEMYRNCAGFFELLRESIETELEEGELGERENWELFEMKMGLKLGRSLSELRELASLSASSRAEGDTIDQFASKLL